MLKEAIGLLEHAYEEIINLEVDEADPIFHESSKAANELNIQASKFLQVIVYPPPKGLNKACGCN